MTLATLSKVRSLAKALTAEDLRALAIECRMLEEAMRVMFGLLELQSCRCRPI